MECSFWIVCHYSTDICIYFAFSQKISQNNLSASSAQTICIILWQFLFSTVKNQTSAPTHRKMFDNRVHIVFNKCVYSFLPSNSFQNHTETHSESLVGKTQRKHIVKKVWILFIVKPRSLPVLRRPCMF